MIESLLLTACLYGTQASCLASGQAYYKWSGIEYQWSEFEKDLGQGYKIGSTIAVIGYGLFYQERLVTPPVGDFGAELDLKNAIYMLRYTRGI